MDWNTIKPELQKKLDPAHIKPAPKGKYGDYVDGYHVISEANRIFGEDGWSYEVTRLEKVSEQTVSLKGQKGPYEQFRVGYLCTVRVRVGDTCKEGAAVGSGVGSPLSIADHHESAIKEAETDALKRALRTYGNTFGLALYDKEKSNIGDSDAPPPFNSPAARDRLKGLIQKVRSLPDLKELWGLEKGALEALHEPHFNEVKKAFLERKTELTPADPAMQAPPETADNGHMYQ